jgi:Cys-rich repeat protein
MKKQTVMLGLAACTTLALAAFRGGCSPELCPDLYIACPELECAQGFKVDKNGCAICECVGDEPVTSCQSDADCPAGLVCVFGLEEPVPMTDARCLDGAEGERCSPELLGQCIEPEPTRCENLDEWTCINTPACEPVYEYAMCDCIDCFCAEQVFFVGCVERIVDPCFGAWLDPNGLCRGPADGVLPQECCGGFECFDDSQCPAGFVCAFPEVECFEGELDCGMLPGGGQCVPVSTGCFDDSQCPAGFVCEFYVDDCPVADGVGCVLPGEGQCVPAVTGCAALDEEQCLSTDGCEATYIDVYCPMNCAADEANCACEPVFGGCVDAGSCWGAWVDQNGVCRTPSDGVYPAECCGMSGCREDADCPNGYCESFASCAGLDCPPPPEAQCVYQNCDDGSQPVCDVAMLPECPAGQTLAVQGGCFACVDARTCEPVLYDCEGSDGCALPGQE